MARKRAAILDAAHREFMAHGFAGTTMEAIAAAAKVSIMTLYRHADDKEDLFRTVIAETCERALEAEPADRGAGQALPLAEALQAYQRYEQLLYGEQLVSVTLEDSQLVMRWPGTASTGPLADTVAIAALWSMLQRLLPQARLQQVCFAFAANAAQQQAAAAHFGCAVAFAQRCTAVMLPAALLALPLAHTDLAMRALLEQHAGAPLDIGHIRLGRSGHVMAQQVDAAAIGLLQADDGVQQNRLAGSRSADHAQNLSPHDVQLQIASAQAGAGVHGHAHEIAFFTVLLVMK